MEDPLDKLDKLFSKRAIQILDQMEFDESASYYYEIMSGGFLWSDEFPDINSDEWKDFGHDFIYRYLLALRRDVMLKHKERELHPLWQQVLTEAPNWPGLREERLTGRIVRRLKAAIRKSNYEIEKALDEEFEET
jgi:hypothetical protein